ncbi:MAG: glycine-rich domain-containing protein [Microcoleus sp.]
MLRDAVKNYFPTTEEIGKLKQKAWEIDFEPIAYKLVNPEDGNGWSIEKTDNMIELYRAFLVLNGMYPHIPIVPTKDLDKVWHAHILDTVKYEADCQFLFGMFFHHFPYFGLRGEEDARNLQAAFENSRSLLLEHFNIDPAKMGTAADCGGGSCQCGCSGTACGGCADDLSAELKKNLVFIGNESDPVKGLYTDQKDRPRLIRN